MSTILCDPETRKDLAEMAAAEQATPQPIDPARDDKRRALIALARTFGVPDTSANRLVEAEQQYLDGLRAGDLGKRLSLLQQRMLDTQQNLSEAKAAQAEAERHHFDALGKADNAQVETCRNQCLAINGRVEIVQKETETLQRLIAEAKSNLNHSYTSGLTGVWQQLGTEAIAQHSEALDQLLEMVSQSEFFDRLSALYVSARTNDYLGQEGYMRRKDMLRREIA